jgi:glutathione S-transferase
MGLKLHYNPLSTFSRRVLIAFAEKQVPHQLVIVDMAARRHREQPYLSLNPYGRVPTLEEAGSSCSSRRQFSIIWRRHGPPRPWFQPMRAAVHLSICT